MKQSSREFMRAALPVTRDLAPVYGLTLAGYPFGRLVLVCSEAKLEIKGAANAGAN